ncbi:hypothetical protein P389DRAFT_199093 [Cystobasidium minutum MCA 4210]|uniref:uncharacterized protein n=1 Tax=Cystobasidium minutum MCA 4210 TaxID=1397322 RepID=UPI0034CF13F7|eukprot:jgi/Rhomi1/199093/gm1.7307_g
MERPLSVDGMTCASCTSAITNDMSGQQGISHFQVNLMSGSANFETADKTTAEAARETIEDLGYGFQIMSVEPISVPPKPSAPPAQYRAGFAIGGMTCASCVGSITNGVRGIAGFSDL